MAYLFYGSDTPDVTPVNEAFAAVKNQRHLYDLLSTIWCAETCSPKMRDGWSKHNITKGQCSITAFLAQDIFGGEVYGVSLKNGNIHCFNVVNGVLFDLTSEQFEKIDYEYNLNFLQRREVHFAREEKRQRYEYLKSKLLEKLQ